MNKLDWSSYDFSQIPFNDIVKVGQRSLLYRDIFNVSWILGRYCNYKCSYCWPYARSDQRDHRPFPVVKKALERIKLQARGNGFNSFHFSFSGGEPTLYPDYIELLKIYSDDTQNTNYQSCHMTTNLSPGQGWLKKYIEATKSLHRVSITASWHREMAKKEEFRDKIIFLQENDVHVTINMVMVLKTFHELQKEAEFFHHAGINVTLKPQSDPTASFVIRGYSPEQLNYLHNGMPQRDYTTARLAETNKTSSRPPSKSTSFRAEIDQAQSKIPQRMQIELTDKTGRKWYMDQAERFNAFNFNQFKGWLCHAGYQGIVIREPDGNIKRSYSCSDAPIGHIESDFNIFPKPEKCITPTCVSSVDSKMPKIRIT